MQAAEVYKALSWWCTCVLISTDHINVAHKSGSTCNRCERRWRATSAWEVLWWYGVGSVCRPVVTFKVLTWRMGDTCCTTGIGGATFRTLGGGRAAEKNWRHHHHTSLPQLIAYNINDDIKGESQRCHLQCQTNQRLVSLWAQTKLANCYAIAKNDIHDIIMHGRKRRITRWPCQNESLCYVIIKRNSTGCRNAGSSSGLCT